MMKGIFKKLNYSYLKMEYSKTDNSKGKVADKTSKEGGNSSQLIIFG